MSSNDHPIPIAPLALTGRDSLDAVLGQIADDSERLQGLAHRQHLAMLGYLLGMVVLEAQQLRQHLTRDD